MNLTWIKSHKWIVALVGAATGGYVLYSFVHRNSSGGTASPITGGMATAGSPQYLVPVVQTGIAPNPTATTPSSNVPVSTTPSTLPATTPKTSTAATLAINPYKVGTRVTSNETITQSVYDPLYHSWVDLTSKGGIYTSPGTSVAGSGYNPAWSGGGRVVLAKGGAAVMEYNAKGTLVGTFNIK